jgi:phosphatidylglycerol:prolipoprotein diacylglycerol transferase
MLLLAVLFAVVVGPFWAKRLCGLPPWTTFRVHVLLAVAALVGGRLHFTLNYGPLTAAGLPWEGLHAGGAVIGLLLAAPVIFALERVHPGRMADAIMPASGVAIFLARLGCFLNGCCFGLRCAYPWCLSFPPGSPANVFQAEHRLVPYDAWSLPVHPLQIYFALTGLLITAVALWLIPRRRYPGQVALVSLLIFTLSAWGLEPLRQDVGLRAYWNGVPQLQVVAGWLVGVALVALVLGEFASRLFTRRAGAQAVSP